MKRAWAVSGMAFLLAVVVFAWAPAPEAWREPLALGCAGLTLTLAARSPLRRDARIRRETEPARGARAAAS